MPRKAADPNDPMTQATTAHAMLKGLEARQARSFKNWSESWKEKKATLLADLSEDAVNILKAGNVLSKRELEIRDEAIKARVVQEEQGGEETQSEDADEDIDA